jgi:hypothetical protein
VEANKNEKGILDRGYLAFLDVLGFSAMVSRDRNGEQIRRYRDCIKDAITTSEVKSVVFSDSIVLTTDVPTPESFLTIARACSRLLNDLLQADIALRGAITFGEFSRSSIGDSVFVAGHALIDAYEWEKKQDWIGVMIAPSALRTVPNLGELCQPSNGYTRGSNTSWMQCIQQNPSIPFHSLHPLDSNYFDGFAIVPYKGDSPAEVWESIKACIKHLQWLRMTAPSPAAQEKYKRAEEWLGMRAAEWQQINAFWARQEGNV